MERLKFWLLLLLVSALPAANSSCVYGPPTCAAPADSAVQPCVCVPDCGTRAVQIQFRWLLEATEAGDNCSSSLNHTRACTGLRPCLSPLNPLVASGGVHGGLRFTVDLGGSGAWRLPLLIVGVSVAGILLLLLLACWCWRRRSVQLPPPLMEEDKPRFRTSLTTILEVSDQVGEEGSEKEEATADHKHNQDHDHNHATWDTRHADHDHLIAETAVDVDEDMHGPLPPPPPPPPSMPAPTPPGSPPPPSPPPTANAIYGPPAEILRTARSSNSWTTMSSSSSMAARSQPRASGDMRYERDEAAGVTYFHSGPFDNGPLPPPPPPPVQGAPTPAGSATIYGAATGAAAAAEGTPARQSPRVVPPRHYPPVAGSHSARMSRHRQAVPLAEQSPASQPQLRYLIGNRLYVASNDAQLGNSAQSLSFEPPPEGLASRGGSNRNLSYDQHKPPSFPPPQPPAEEEATEPRVRLTASPQPMPQDSIYGFGALGGSALSLLRYQHEPFAINNFGGSNPSMNLKLLPPDDPNAPPMLLRPGSNRSLTYRLPGEIGPTSRHSSNRSLTYRPPTGDPAPPAVRSSSNRSLSFRPPPLDNISGARTPTLPFVYRASPSSALLNGLTNPPPRLAGSPTRLTPGGDTSAASVVSTAATEQRLPPLARRNANAATTVTAGDGKNGSATDGRQEARLSATSSSSQSTSAGGAVLVGGGQRHPHKADRQHHQIVNVDDGETEGDNDEDDGGGGGGGFGFAGTDVADEIGVDHNGVLTEEDEAEDDGRAVDVDGVDGTDTDGAAADGYGGDDDEAEQHLIRKPYASADSVPVSFRPYSEEEQLAAASDSASGRPRVRTDSITRQNASRRRKLPEPREASTAAAPRSARKSLPAMLTNAIHRAASDMAGRTNPLAQSLDIEGEDGDGLDQPLVSATMYGTVQRPQQQQQRRPGPASPPGPEVNSNTLLPGPSYRRFFPPPTTLQQPQQLYQPHDVNNDEEQEEATMESSRHGSSNMPAAAGGGGGGGDWTDDGSMASGSRRSSPPKSLRTAQDADFDSILSVVHGNGPRTGRRTPRGSSAITTVIMDAMADFKPHGNNGPAPAPTNRPPSVAGTTAGQAPTSLLRRESPGVDWQADNLNRLSPSKAAYMARKSPGPPPPSYDAAVGLPAKPDPMAAPVYLHRSEPPLPRLEERQYDEAYRWRGEPDYDQVLPDVITIVNPRASANSSMT